MELTNDKLKQLIEETILEGSKFKKREIEFNKLVFPIKKGALSNKQGRFSILGKNYGGENSLFTQESDSSEISKAKFIQLIKSYRDNDDQTVWKSMPQSWKDQVGEKQQKKEKVQFSHDVLKNILSTIDNFKLTGDTEQDKKKT